MPVLIYIDHADGLVKKSSLEAICYGRDLAEKMGVPAEGILLGTVTEDLAALGKYGVSKIHQVKKRIPECAGCPGIRTVDFWPRSIHRCQCDRFFQTTYPAKVLRRHFLPD